jgi:spore maturation protein CgeB
MSVVIVGSRAFDSMEYHLNDSFTQLGHTSTIIDQTDVGPIKGKAHYWTMRFFEPYGIRMCAWLADRIAACKPDLVVVVYRHLHPELVRQVKLKLPGIPVVQVNPDALSNLDAQQIIASDFDFYFTKDPFIADFLRAKAGLNAHYLPEGFNPRLHCRPALDRADIEQEDEADVLIFGGLYAYRARMVQKLLSAGIRVALYGQEGPYCPDTVKRIFRKQYLVGEAKNRLLYSARIVFNNFHYAEVTSANQKYFEINGIGGFQLCDYKPTLDE